MYQNFFKRLLDFLFALAVLIFISPLFLLIMLCIKFDSKGPALFKQVRVGKEKKDFYILKFRTMRIDSPKNIPTSLLQNPEAHITKVGKILRKTSLDELPQLINIIKGEMSVIGPRPVIRKEFDLILEREKQDVYNTMPGLSGWAQVNGRDEITIEEKAKLDGEYVKKISFAFDLKIFLLTISTVIKSKGFREGVQIRENNAETKVI